VARETETGVDPGGNDSAAADGVSPNVIPGRPAGGSSHPGAPGDSHSVASSAKRDGTSPWLAFLQARSRQTRELRPKGTVVSIRAWLPGRPDRDQLWQAQGLLWCAFAFAVGIVLYRFLPEEPDWRVLVPASIVLGVILGGRNIKTGLAPGSLLAVCIVAGVVAGTLRTAVVDAPRLGEPMTARLDGMVIENQVRRSGARLVLEVEAVNGIPNNGGLFVERVRLRVPETFQALPGDRVSVRARLFPPMGPVSPGGYDYSFRAFFDGIGASGFSYGAPEAAAGPLPGFIQKLTRRVDQIRRQLAERIEASLDDGPETALAIALLVGDRSRIDEATEESLRVAGLAHILAISGLHMALFAGGAYAACLAVLAVFPVLVLRWPLHKAAAVLALIAAVIYLVLSGASVATQRSFLMIALVFLGVLTGRRGLTLRSVALAGFVLLILAPERLFSPGFQMSFAAVIALVAVYELWRVYRRDRLSRHPSVTGTGRVVRVLGGWLAGLLVTAMVAGTATGIIGAYHFARIAPFGVLGNLIGMPVFSLLVMPAGVLAFVLMPFGLAVLPLTVMSFGLGLILKAAAFTESLAPDIGRIGVLGAPSAFLLIAALFAVLLLPGRLRSLSLVPLLAGATFVALSRPPDIQIPASGPQIAARDVSGVLRLASARGSFAAETWLEAEGESVEGIKSRKMNERQRRCDPDGCVILAHLPGRGGQSLPPLKVALPRSPEGVLRDCWRADIIVSDKSAPGNCRAGLVIDQAVREDGGAISIWLDRPDPGKQPSAGAPYVLAEEGRPVRQRQGQGAEKPVVAAVETSLTRPPRPWHRPGTVTRSSLRPK